MVFGFFETVTQSCSHGKISWISYAHLNYREVFEIYALNQRNERMPKLKRRRPSHAKSYRPFQTCVQSLFWNSSNNFKHEHKFLIIEYKTHYQKKWFALSAFDTNGFCNSEMFHYVTFMISNKYLENFRKIINKFSPSSCAKSYFLMWGGRARDVNKALWELFAGGHGTHQPRLHRKWLVWWVANCSFSRFDWKSVERNIIMPILGLNSSPQEEKRKLSVHCRPSRNSVN